MKVWYPTPISRANAALVFFPAASTFFHSSKILLFSPSENDLRFPSDLLVDVPFKEEINSFKSAKNLLSVRNNPADSSFLITPSFGLTGVRKFL